MIGKALGHYQIAGQIGKGGMDEVFGAMPADRIKFGHAMPLFRLMLLILPALIWMNGGCRRSFRKDC